MKVKVIIPREGNLDYYSNIIPIVEKLPEHNIEVILPSSDGMQTVYDRNDDKLVYLQIVPLKRSIEKKIKLVVVPHGLAEGLWFHDVDWVDYLMVSGPIWEQRDGPKLKKFKGKIIVTGMPKMDILFTNPNLREETIANYKINLPYDFTVLYPAGTINDPVSKALPPLISLSSQLKFNLIIKTKNDEMWREFIIKTIEQIEAQSQDKKQITWILSCNNICKLYSVSDMLIGGATGTVREFYATGKPSFQYIDKGVGEEHFEEANKIFIKDFQQIIEDTRKDPDKYKPSKETIEGFHFGRDGKATERAIEVIKKAMKELEE